MEADDLKDIYTAFRADPKDKVVAAFSFGVWDANSHAIGYIFLASVATKYREKGHFSQFVDILKDFVASEVKGRNYDSAWILAGMSLDTRPHQVFKKMGFTRDIPDHLCCLQQVNCDMTALEVGVEEEEKKAASSVGN